MNAQQSYHHASSGHHQATNVPSGYREEDDAARTADAAWAGLENTQPEALVTSSRKAPLRRSLFRV